MEASFDTWTSLFLIAVVQGFFLSGMIFIQKSRANNLLGALTLAFSLCLLCYVGYWTKYNSLINWRFNVLIGLTYTLGPLLYLYIKSSKKEVAFNLLHFIPFLLFVVHFQNWGNYPESWGPYIRSFQPIIQSVHLLIYSLLAYSFVKKNKEYTNGALKLYKWRKKVTLAFLSYSISFLTYFILVWTNLLEIQYDYMISFASAFFIYFIGYHGFLKPEVFHQYESGKYEKSGLQSSASQAILDKVRSQIESEKIFLDSSLRLPDLANRLKISQHYISQAINDLEGKNFADFINEYRIKEAKRLLAEGDEKLIQVAYKSGFNNKNSFNNAFKKISGVPPSKFRKQYDISN